MQQFRVIDSHTGGEPTRVVVDSPVDLGTGPLAERVARLRAHHDWVRRAVVNEPRGSDVFVGALLCPPSNPTAAAGVIFFNNVGYLGMCGHGTIGVAATLRRLGRLRPGAARIETPVGDVTIELHDDESVSVENVACHRTQKLASLDVPGIGTIRGDVAWGGNWFFLVQEHGQSLRYDRVRELTAFTQHIRDALDRSTLRGEGGALIDHVELFGPPTAKGARSRNFVLCPGGAYDRSPCGTGTSAKVACLAADGKLAPGEEWVQESIVGSVFRARYRLECGRIIPTITGQAYINGETTILLDPHDPFATGIPEENR
ncbi:MAG: proline racemase family protein [Planctomycetes bacterium]|nr:proline racemase family protein [Planctomycetota bacterium]